MLTRWQSSLAVAVAGAFLAVTFAAAPAEARGKSDAGKYIAGALVGAIIVAALADDDHPRRHHKHVTVRYFHCPCCGYFGPYRGKSWAIRYHSHGHHLVLKVHKGPFRKGVYVHYHKGRPHYYHHRHHDHRGGGIFLHW